MRFSNSETNVPSLETRTGEEYVFETLLKRKSTRAFAPTPVPSWMIYRLFEAARWAPSSFNEQPWRYIVTSPGTRVERQQLLDCLSESNRSWATDAPVLILASAVTSHVRSGALNRHALYDLGQSVANLSTEATALGLAVHQIGGFSVDQARAVFQIPDGVEPVVVLAIGVAGDPSVLLRNLHTMETAPRNRKPITETVFYGTWNGPAAASSEPD